ncbi:rho GTPase-activating protein 7 isoform X1 [Papilio machaon]|uniref:rho GTPase-activating protein 7 isoform X1 n=1 Tax=Papilio machaon TaxID=76193 RepID=UPI001E663B9A|nr:rho GTPase-activating protein 7 isoform X1 [Papilio machaon]
MASPSTTPKAPSPPPPGHGPSKMERRMSHFKEYKFFRSFSAKVENWPMRKAEQLWRKMRERKIAEIEAAEACKWLRAAGFPQYAQMYEDLQFPIDISGVQNDHPFLDADSLQSLFRRLTALNRCANMKLEHHHHQKRSNDSDDEQCALSEHWQYERKSRRWSRVVEITPQAQRRLQVIAARALAEREAREARGEVEDDEDETLPTIRVGLVDADGHYTDVEPDLLTVPGQTMIQLPSDKEDEEDTGTRFRRTGSERLRDGAKALLRRVESLKTRRRKRQNRTEVIVSSPHFLDVQQDRYPDLNYIDMTPTSPTQFPFPDFHSSPTHSPAIRTQPPSPMTIMPPSPIAPLEQSFVLHPPFGDDSSSYASDGSMGSSNKSSKSKLGRAKRIFHRGLRSDDSSALSDSECQPASWRHNYYKELNAHHHNTEVYVEPPSPVDLKPDPAVLREVQQSPAHTPHRRQAIRTSSLNLGKEAHKFRDRSLKRDKSASRSSELDSSPNSAGSRSHDGDQDDDDDSLDLKTKKNNIQRWYSFRTSTLNGGPKANNTLQPATNLKDPETYLSRPMSSLSCGQLHILRKLALLRLTACMERYCPSHKSGWNWELPKLIRKIKTPDYKDKTVFGVPLTVSLQRTGHSLPKPIQCALNWLKTNALDQMGIFRKAGVKSRIAKLRAMVEAAGAANAAFASENINVERCSLNFDGAQAHDVADLVKQYFRELPDALLTNKLSETFIAIFQHVPEPLRPDAVQCALLLLPEEHLEALHSLLIFLSEVAEHSAVNQMTASNLAVCLAPTLLRLHHAPPHTGSTKEGNSNRMIIESVADQRQISESRAAHACLLLLIARHHQLFLAPADMLARCKFNYFEESVPVALEELGADFNQDWKGFQQACIKALLKEAKEKSRGWMSVSGAAGHVELCCKKVGDGHPLRLWRATTDVEAPPQEVMQRILRERHIWDDTLVKWRVVEKLGTNAEVFQYITASSINLPPRDYCVLRSWQQGGGSGGGGWCAVAETSVAHAGAVPGAPSVPGATGAAGAVSVASGARGVVLASRYLAQPAGKGRSRLVHLARVDTMGRTPEWYNKCYGHICALYLARIRASFKHNTEGPESNV